MTVEEVRGSLDLTDNGAIKNSIRNCLTVFQNDPVLQGAVRYNILTERIDIVKPLWWSKQTATLTDTDLNYLMLYLEDKYSLTSEKKIQKALSIIADSNKYHPIRDYLNGLEWDGTERIRYALPRFLGAEEGEYTYQALRLFMLGAISRVFKPGCKFEVMLCLVGGQGAGKSTFFRLLAVKDEWFSDDLKKIDDDNVYRKMQGHWIIEMSEMIATANAKSIEDIKSFISRAKETYKVPYETHPADRLRQCVFGGSSNTMDFLPLDRSGNRRFLPIMVHPENAEIHILEDEAASRAFIDMMWAEVMFIYQNFPVKLTLSKDIRVWSTQEGEQRFDNHTDKLLNYIRFWQADGESEKTSVRTRTSLRQLVEEGHFKGGSAPYGYDLVKSGRINKRKHELYELHINEQEAEIVRLIFDKYVYEGYGAQRIATYLNNAGYRARSGKCWHPGSLRGMVGNLTYMGVLRCGDARSELMPELQIIPQEEFEAAQRIREDRSAHAAEEAEHHVPLRTRGQALLSNNVYCGHCGARLALTTSRKWRKLSDGTLDDTLRIRYTCYGKLRKQTDCTGQTGYTMHILDEIIDKMVRQIFSRLRGIPKEQLITSRYAKETAERKNHLQALQAERDKAEKDLLALKTEILAVIKGESAFPKDTLAEMIAAQEKKHTELDTLCEEASAELERNAELMANVSQLYEELISYADLYDSASFEAKKMIVSQLIRRVEVYRGYQIHVDFNFDLAQYLENSDELAC